MPFQFQKARLEIPLSKTDWIKKVLEPIGWGRYYVLAFPAPALPSDTDFGRVSEEIQKATDLFLAGHDAGVFLHPYHALDSMFYSKRDEIRSKVSGGGDSKQGAVEDLIKAVHRFSNGGRHLPEDRAKTGGFEVDHVDAEYVRGLVALTVAYLAKRLQIHKLLSGG